MGTKLKKQYFISIIWYYFTWYGKRTIKIKKQKAKWTPTFEKLKIIDPRIPRLHLMVWDWRVLRARPWLLTDLRCSFLYRLLLFSLDPFFVFLCYNFFLSTVAAPCQLHRNVLFPGRIFLFRLVFGESVRIQDSRNCEKVGQPKLRMQDCWGLRMGCQSLSPGPPCSVQIVVWEWRTVLLLSFILWKCHKQSRLRVLSKIIKVVIILSDISI